MNRAPDFRNPFFVERYGGSSARRLPAQIEFHSRTERENVMGYIIRVLKHNFVARFDGDLTLGEGGLFG